ncbi:MAG TPA: phage tail protein, partial [Mycolicibacterium fallax]|nr:phage tail protein [Mycolicibacterium fallax]
MSNAGQAVLSIGGAFVGFWLGGPAGAAWGFQIGSMAGGLLFPTDLGTVTGPRLDDLRVMTSTIGQPIPLVYGTFALAGNCIWSSGLIEAVNKEEVGGKGGPSQTVKTYSYSVDVAIGICEGPVNGIRRIWADAVLIYDISAQRAGETDAEFAERMAVSEQTAAIMAFYDGSETQLPDPTIEAREGSGNVPAFRGLAYLVLDGLQLEKFGNRVPSFRVEVFKGELVANDCPAYANEVLYPWVSGLDPRNPLNAHHYLVEYIGSSADSSAYTGPDVSTWISDFTQFLSAANSGGRDFTTYFGGFTTGIYDADTSLVASISPGELLDLRLHYASIAPQFSGLYGGGNICDRAFALGPDPGDRSWIGLPHGAYGFHLSTSAIHTFLVGGASAPAEYDATITCYPDNLAVKSNRVLRVQRVTSAPLDTADDANYEALPGVAGYFVERATGTIVKGRVWQYQAGTFKVLQSYAYGGSPVSVTKYPLNPVLPVGHADYDSQTFWEAAYAVAVAQGDMSSGLTYGVHYPVVQGFAYVAVCTANEADTDCILIADIVSDLCARSGLTAIDVTDLSTCIEGYAVTRVMSARDAIEPLRTVGLFDAVESGETLKFVERGHAAVATLSEEDLCAHAAEGGRPAAVEVARKQEKELPRSVRLHYASAERAYEAMEQQATRITTAAEGATDIELAVSISDDRAITLAEIVLYTTWVGRNSYRFVLDHGHMQLEPTDCLMLPVDSDLIRVRIASLDYSVGGLLAVEAIRDDQDIYTGSGVSYAPPAAAGPGVAAPPVCPHEALFLDIPRLRDEILWGRHYIAVNPHASILTDYLHLVPAVAARPAWLPPASPWTARGRRRR